MKDNAIRLLNHRPGAELRDLEKDRVAGSPEGQAGIRPLDTIPTSAAGALAGDLQALGKAFVTGGRPFSFYQAVPAAGGERKGKIEHSLQSFASIAKKTSFDVYIGLQRCHAEPYQMGPHPPAPIASGRLQGGFRVRYLIHQAGIA